MKKNFNKGFVLAETLVVTVFLLAIFAMIYSDYFPLIGEFEKREVYDDVDSKYGVFWIKRLIEDPAYSLREITSDPRENNKHNKKRNYLEKGYFRFECSDINDPQKRETCASLVNALEIASCDATTGDNCDIYVTKYQIGATTTAFKDTVATNLKHQSEECFPGAGDCKQLFITSCIGNDKTDLKRVQCTEKADKNVFTSGFQDYIFTLPDYKNSSLNGAQYRVFAVFKHKRDNNDYFSYATIEVNK